MELEREINKKISSKLERSGFCVIRNSRFITAEIDIIALNLKSLELASYEIKRNNWKKVLIQAVRNKSYCHFSYAVLPEERGGKVKLQDFQKHGIGLIFFKVLKKGIRLNVILNPEKSDGINQLRKKSVYSRFEDVLR